MEQDVLAGLAGVLLMGGESRRMGRDKGIIAIDGMPLWERHWELLGTVARPRYRTVPSGQPPGEGILPDPAPSPGPLPGIAAALAAMPGDWLLVLAVDLIGVDARIVEHLYRERVTGGVVMPR
ncbi:MAG: molybdenum cofactor guanylyltransferase, partial [Clostridia bacterium]